LRLPIIQGETDLGRANPPGDAPLGPLDEALALGVGDPMRASPLRNWSASVRLFNY